MRPRDLRPRDGVRVSFFHQKWREAFGFTLFYGEIIIYPTEDGLSKIEVIFKNETVWLSIDQMAELFQRDRSVIGKHVRNIFKEGELKKDSVWAKFAYTATDDDRLKGNAGGN